MIIPLIKKQYPKLIADKLVNTQPLSGPSALIHYLRYRYKINCAASQDVINAISEWLSETFHDLVIKNLETEIVDAENTNQLLSKYFTIQKDTENEKILSIICLDKHLICQNNQFTGYREKQFDYYDSNFFDLLYNEITEYFKEDINNVSIDVT